MLRVMPPKYAEVCLPHTPQSWRWLCEITAFIGWLRPRPSRNAALPVAATSESPANAISLPRTLMPSEKPERKTPLPPGASRVQASRVEPVAFSKKTMPPRWMDQSPPDTTS